MAYAELAAYAPLSLVILVPTISGFYQLLFTSLHSPIHFQQGVHDVSPWQSALACTLLAVAPFVCLLPLTSASSLFLYPVGYVCALLIATFLFSPVLHYIPSPSICQYIHLRFQLPFLRLFVVIIHIFLITSFAVFLLVFSTSFVTQISTLSPIIVCPLIGYFGIFSIIFGGQTTISSPVFFLPFIAIFSGVGLLLYNGVEELYGLRENIELRGDLASPPAWISFSLGVLNGFHLLTSSPLLYQAYFGLSTRHRLRTAFLLHALLFSMLSVSLLCTSCLYGEFLTSFCPLSPSVSSLLQYFRYTIPHSAIFSFFVATSFMLITCVSFSSVLLSLSSLVWEDLLRNRFTRWSQVKQLCTLQVMLFLMGTFITGYSSVIAYYCEDIVSYAAFLLISLSSVAAPLTALMLCAYVLPCTNRKGAVCGPLAAYCVLVLLSLLHFRGSVLEPPRSPCANSTTAITVLRSSAASSTSTAAPFLLNDNNNSTLLSQLDVTTDFSSPSESSQSSTDFEFFHFLQTIPFSAFPLVAFLISCLCTIWVSICSGGDDVLALDWNLMVCASFAHILVRHSTITSHSRRAFIESESFRYAQQTPYPEINYSNSKVSLFQRGQKAA